MARRPLVLLVALLALPVLALAGCNALIAAFERDRATTTRELHEEARALVPESARIVSEEESACLELRSFPSCVVLYLDWDGPYAARRGAADRRLRERGWEPAAGGAPSFVLARDGLEASFLVRRRGELWGPACAGRDPAALDRLARSSCLDSVLVRMG
jgi:hypothetical protein